MPRAGAIVLTGQGSVFSAGGDLDVLSEWHTWSLERRSRYVEEGPQAVISWLLNAPVATVCAVNGAAYGAGFELALACDLRIASTDATFCEAFIRIEVVPGDGGTWLLPRFVGIGRALDMLLTGRVVAADEALSIGLVSPSRSGGRVGHVRTGSGTRAVETRPVGSSRDADHWSSMR